MITLIKKLYQINILKPKGLYFFVKAVLANGTNLMSVLEFSARLNPNKVAVNSEGEKRTYRELKIDCFKLGLGLKQKFNLKPKQRVAIVCRNNLQAVQSLYSLSRLGVNIYFLNTENSENQLSEVIINKKIDLLIYDDILESKLKLVSCQKLKSSSIRQLINDSVNNMKLPKVKAGALVMLSGGTTGKPKSAKRKPSIGDFLNPLVALLSKLNLNKFQSVYIATPFYHGFGLASLIMSILLGSEIHLLEKFDAKKACEIIDENKIEVVTLVPIMLRRMMVQNLKSLSPIKRIICGGAKIDQELVRSCLSELGDVLYNLYGTTEAGFSILAEPNQLKSNPLTIGQPIRGVSVKIVDENNIQKKVNEIGQIHLKNGWMMNNSKENWINTDDLGYVNHQGLIFLSGRSDNMIISGGENVYPDELENVLIEHLSIEEVAVVGVSDSEYGQRMIAYIVVGENEKLNTELLFNWLKPKVARHQIPKKFVQLNAFPLTSIGKVDRKELMKLNKLTD